VTLAFALFFLLQTPAAAACPDAAECRAQAEAAATRGEFEMFHDLAWRAVQKGRRNDPDLMYLLARAQSLSGRPDDALVMLERIADQGVKKADAATNPDFARVRQLARWPELAAKLGVPVSPDGSAGAAPTAPAPAAPTAPAPSAPTAPAAPTAPDSLSFDAPAATLPVALAHDAVSRRFVLGDRSAARLVVIDEMSHHVVNYASASTAGFYDDLTSFSIDARRGDLWVVSAKGQGDGAASVVHKLQLVSGRTLLEARLPDGAGASRLVDVAVTPDGTVYAIDEVGPRLFRLRPGARRFEQVMKLEALHPSAIAAADDRALYVAEDGGLLHIDLASNTATRVKSVEELTRFVSLAWRGGALVGVERVAESYLVVRIALDASGTRAQPRAILAASTQPTVGTLAPEGFYYLASPGSIRLVKVR